VTADGRARLVAAAVTVVQLRGYDGAGLTAILTAADLPKGSLYHHFPSGKDALVAAAVDFIAAELVAEIDALAAGGRCCAAIIDQLIDAQRRWMAKTGWRSVGLLGALAAVLPADARRTAAALAQANRAVRASLAAAGADSAAVDAGLTRLHGAAALARMAADHKAET
jgi:TetR/AcrR family transcriptional regulator, lmrAB and yxaGH operons repressor